MSDPGVENAASDQTYWAFADQCRPAQAGRPTRLGKPLPDILCGRFRVERLLGVGGMGAVYRGRDLLREQFGDPCPVIALKTLSEEFAEHAGANALLHNEFAVTSRLHHKHVIRLFSFEIDPVSERAFIVMELLQGCTLDQLLLRYPQGLPWPKARDIAQALLHALAYSHRQGVIHGDIKPNNLMLGDLGIRLFDFGLGQAEAAPLTSLPTLARDRFTAWTPRYAAPELLDGNPLSRATDLYAAACVIYELCHGQHPYPGLVTQTGTTEFVPQPAKPSDMPQHIWHVLKQYLVLDPDKRLDNAEILLAAVQTPSRLSQLVFWHRHN